MRCRGPSRGASRAASCRTHDSTVSASSARPRSPTEDLSSIQVLNGLAGSLYGPAVPAGVFSYTLKRPTDIPFATYRQSFEFELGVHRVHRCRRTHARRNGRLPVQCRSRPGRELGSAERRQSHAGERGAGFPCRRPYRDRDQLQPLLDQHHGPPGSFVYFNGARARSFPGRSIRLGSVTGSQEPAPISLPIPASSNSNMNSTTIGIWRSAVSIRMPSAICSASPIP